MYALPSAPLSVGGVVDDAIKLFRSSFTRCWIFSAIIGVLLLGMQLVLLLAMPGLAAPGRPDATKTLAALGSPGTIGLFIGLYLLVIFVSLVCYGGMLTRQAAIARGDESVTLARAFATGVRRFPGMLLAALLCILAIVAGLILLIIPGIWVMVRLYLWMAAMFADDAGALGSLETSWRLTKGHWWRAVAILSVTMVLFVVVSIAFNLVAGVIAGVSRVKPVDLQLISASFQALCYTIGYPFLTAAWLVMYHDFKLRREGGDLASRLGALSSA